ncbi:PIN domain-containing protein [Phenylobacterium sp.]|uniref:type II toxin-antitoxin system VapC family toxin n=1 Tax=Phenylobacterium sp. TaxID=1871053 RepID=UPI0025FD756E|nr:PIN domain-containing protein [Phenylobacterium sp.]MBX3483392.1 PIN domain-containing protein [Phenylobacterium sp.]MCW5759712.1 PIN domain-containing protein [Phenylobacterium sp.]
MTLVDTSIWVEHLKVGSVELARLLDEGRVLGHPFVIGELALGGLRGRDRVLRSMTELPQAVVATHDEVMSMIDRRRLWGRGVGFVDAHLLAAAALSGAELWTQDRGLAALAGDLGLGRA